MEFLITLNGVSYGGEHLFSSTFSTNCNKDRVLHYGTVAEAHYSFEADFLPSKGQTFILSIRDDPSDQFEWRAILTVTEAYAVGGHYRVEAYDGAHFLTADERKTLEESAEENSCFYYWNANGTRTSGYFSSTPIALTDYDFKEARISAYSSSGEGKTYYPCSVEMFKLNGLWLGSAFTIDSKVSYVMGITLTANGVTIESVGTDGEEFPHTISDTIIEQGETITSLTTTVGEIEAKVGRKVQSYSQETAPTGDLVVGDLWYKPSTGKWYRWSGTAWVLSDDATLNSSVASLTIAVGEIESLVESKTTVYRQATAPTSPLMGDLWWDTTNKKWKRWNGTTWDTLEDGAITSLSSRIDQTAGQITAEVSRATTAEGGLGARIDTANGRIDLTESSITAEVTRAKVAEGDLDDAIETTNGRIDVTDGRITTEVSRATTAEDGLGDLIDQTNGRIDVTNTNVTAEVTRATGAESALDASKINNSGYLTKTGYRWNLTDSAFTVDRKSGSTWANVMTVNNTGLLINGSGTFTGSVTASSGKIGIFDIDTDANNRLVASTTTDAGVGMSVEYLQSGVLKAHTDMSAGGLSTERRDSSANKMSASYGPLAISVVQSGTYAGRTFYLPDDVTIGSTPGAQTRIYSNNIQTGRIKVDSNSYGTSLPEAGTTGQIFFLIS